MEHYSAIKNNEFTKFLGKWMELENITLSEVTQSRKNTSYADKWILVPKLRILKIKFTDHMKLKKKEDQSVDNLILLRRGIKIPMGRYTETKCGTGTEGKATQRLPYLGIHSIYSYQTQTLLWMSTSTC